MKTILYTARVCVCCLMKLANDDTSGCDDSRIDGSEHPHGLMADIDGHAVPGLPMAEHFAGCGIRDDRECDYECETNDFSRSRCDGCGSELAGTRHAVTVLSS